MKYLDLFDSKEVTKKKIKKLKEQAEDGKGIQINLNFENPFTIIKGKKYQIDEIIFADISECAENYYLQTLQNKLSSYENNDSEDEFNLFLNREDEDAEAQSQNIKFKLHLYDGKIFKYFPEKTCKSPYDGLAVYFKTSDYFGIIMLDYSDF